jgi:hypothetical protein
LPQPSSKGEKTKGTAIHKNRQGRRGDSNSDPRDPSGTKSYLFQDSQEKTPLHSIKSLFHIHFHKYVTTFASFGFESMQEFMDQNSIILNVSFRNKSRLQR